MPKMNPTASRDYAIQRLTDGAPTQLILDELVSEQGVKLTVAADSLAKAKEMIARNFDEPDYQLIRACAFAGDSYRQRYYRERIEQLTAEQKKLSGGSEAVDGLDTEKRLRLILACDRSAQAWSTLSLRGRRDLPVAFAPKGVLQNQEPPTEDDIEDAIKGAL